MTDSQKLDLLLGKMVVMEKEVGELRLHLGEIVGENIRLRKLNETTDENNTSEKLLDDIRRIAEGKRISRFETES